MKRFFCFIISFVVCFTTIMTFGACSSHDDESETIIDETKTQIFVGTYDGGVGDAWIYNVGKKFEEKYADYQNGDRVGVQIIVDKAKNGMDGPTLLGSLLSSRDEVFFTEDVYYYDYLSKKVLMDVTDAVSTPLSEFGESESILQKLNQTYDSYYNSNGSYYALPFYEGFYGMIYDVDLFEKKGLYFKENATANGVNVKSLTEVENLFVETKTDKKSKGPDGIENTMDDGLPATYNDFYALMTMMKGYGIVPFIWTGAFTSYVQRFAGEIWADYEGKDNIRLNMDLSGTANDLVESISNGEAVLETVPTIITAQNANLLQKQAGKYYALKFIKNIVSDSTNFSKLSFSGSNSHTGAQDEFLMGSYDSSMDTIAILIDGNWWESEASSTFNAMANEIDERASKLNRRFAFMPVPKANADKIGDATVYDCSSSSCFIRKNVSSEKQYIVKQFYRFCHTQEALDIFTQTTSMTRAFDYKLTNTDSISYYAKSVFELHNNNSIISAYSNNSAWLNDIAKYKMENWAFSTKINGNNYTNPFTTFKNYPSITVEQYFEGLYKNYSN